jgi:hypothetical protein
MAAFVSESRQDSQAAKEQAIAREFHRLAPDFPATPEAGNAVLKYAQENGIALTPKGLKAAHLACVAEGIYKPLSTAEVASRGPQNLRPAPVVTPSGSSETVTDETPNVNWTWDQIKAYEARLKAAR